MTSVNEGVLGPLILVIGALAGAALADWLNRRSEIRRNRREKLEEIVLGLGEVHEAFHAILGDPNPRARFRNASSIILRVSALARVHCAPAHFFLQQIAVETSRAAKCQHASVTGDWVGPVSSPYLSSFRVVTLLNEAENAAILALQDANKKIPEVWFVDLFTWARQLYRSLWSRQHLEK